MKIGSLIIGLLIGSVLMYLFVKQPWTKTENFASTNSEPVWPWPDSLDALIAAPDNHKLVYEDSSLRILSVTVVPGILDPIHTHKGRSIIWVTKTSPILYNTYDYGENNTLKLIKTDTINIKPEELNKANWEKPEPPHSVENIGKDTFHLYRIEYKK